MIKEIKARLLEVLKNPSDMTVVLAVCVTLFGGLRILVSTSSFFGAALSRTPAPQDVAGLLLGLALMPLVLLLWGLVDLILDVARKQQESKPVKRNIRSRRE